MADTARRRLGCVGAQLYVRNRMIRDDLATVLTECIDLTGGYRALSAVPNLWATTLH